MKRRNG